MAQVRAHRRRFRSTWAAGQDSRHREFIKLLEPLFTSDVVHELQRSWGTGVNTIVTLIDSSLSVADADWRFAADDRCDRGADRR